MTAPARGAGVLGGCCRAPSGLLLLPLLTCVGLSAQEGLAPLPPMGYNTWNDLECKPQESKLRKIADKLKKVGFLALGYQYITVDDCWMSQNRDSEGRLEADSAAFPQGMPATVKYVHGLGFKFGIYTDRGPNTCVGFPGSMGNEELDAKTFAEWGVDLVKNDGCWDPDCGVYQPQYPGSGTCGAQGRLKALQKYSKMSEALNQTGRSILHSICGWQPWYAPVGRQLGHMWRIAADVKDWEGVYEAARIMEQMWKYHGPNGWCDPDMLLGSTPGAKLTLTPTQARAQFSLWCVMAAPLILGVSVRSMSGFDTETYSNKEAIRVNQDPLGRPAHAVVSNCPVYPKFNLGVSPDGTPTFGIPKTSLYEEDVVCGSHTARSCSECPQGHGEGWCHGECRWIASTKKCIPDPNAGEKKEKPKKRVDENPEPWTMALFKKPEMRQCQQVWTKELQGGAIALLAINWASEYATLSVPLAALQLPWSGDGAIVRDLWYKGPLVNPHVVSETLEFQLKADGGHALLRLRAAPNSTGSRGSPMVVGGGGFLVKKPASTDAGNPELSPAEERLRLIAQRERFRERLQQAAQLDPDDEEGGNGAADIWLVPVLLGLAMLLVFVLLLTRLGSFRALLRRGGGGGSGGARSGAAKTT